MKKEEEMKHIWRKERDETYRHVTLGVASIHSPSLVPSLLSGAGSWAATAEAKESP